MHEIKVSAGKSLFGRDFNDTSKCVICGSDKVSREDFRDALSLREWQISHMCQVCQDSVFGEDDE